MMSGMGLKRIKEAILGGKPAHNVYVDARCDGKGIKTLFVPHIILSFYGPHYGRHAVHQLTIEQAKDLAAALELATKQLPLEIAERALGLTPIKEESHDDAA